MMAADEDISQAGSKKGSCDPIKRAEEVDPLITN